MISGRKNAYLSTYTDIVLKQRQKTVSFNQNNIRFSLSTKIVNNIKKDHKYLAVIIRIKYKDDQGVYVRVYG